MHLLARFRDAIKRSWYGAILRDHDTEPTELAGGLMKVVLGAWLLVPLETFGSSESWAVIQLIPETALGAALLAVGAGHLAALRDGRYRWRYAASLLGFVVWFTFGASFWVANAATVGVPIFMLAAFGQGWTAIRLWEHSVRGDC